MARFRKYKLLFISCLILLFLVVTLTILPLPSKTWKLPSSSNVIAFSHDSKMLAMASGKLVSQDVGAYLSIHATSSQVQIRKINNGQLIQTFDFLSTQSLAFSPDNHLIAAGGYGGEVKVWRIDDGRLIHHFQHSEHNTAKTIFLSFTPDGQKLITSINPRSSRYMSNISVWDLSTDRNIYSISQHFSCVAASSDGQVIAIGGDREPVTFYQLRNKNFRIPINKYPKCLYPIFSINSKIFAFYRGYEGTRIHRVEDGKLLNIISTQKPYENKQSLTDMSLSPNNRYLATSYQPVFESSIFIGSPSYYKALFGRIRFWDIETGKRIATYPGHIRGINTLAFSPDGKWIASAGKVDEKIHFWRVSNHNYFLQTHNYFLQLIVTSGLAAVAYWRRAWLMNLFNRNT